jgi:hypothetical protein
LQLSKVLSLVLVLALAGMVAAVAGAQTTSDTHNAAKYCKQLRTASGGRGEPFREAVATLTHARKVTIANAYGKCVSYQARQNARDRQQAHRSALETCRSERNDPNFPTNHNGQTFDQVYGGGHGNAAFHNCVAQHQQQSLAQARQANSNEVNAARQCRAQRDQDRDAFNAQWGSNTNHRNAFGKCVSHTARDLNQQRGEGSQQQA